MDNIIKGSYSLDGGGGGGGGDVSMGGCGNDPKSDIKKVIPIFNIDGPNGSGKSSVSLRVMDMLREISGVNVVNIHFHRRGMPIGDVIQSVLDGVVSMDPIALQMLYTADRVDFTKRQYKQILNTPTKAILVNRYTTSGIVYSQLAGVDINTIYQNENDVKTSDINFILDAPTKVLQDRLRVLNPIGKGDIFENNHLDEVNKLYSQIRGNNTIHIDANRPIELVASEIFFVIKIFFSGGTLCLRRF